jgi:hypothetical protein
MIPIPAIKYCFLVARDGSGLVEWALHMVGLSCRMYVECLEIYGSLWKFNRLSFIINVAKQYNNTLFKS